MNVVESVQKIMNDIINKACYSFIIFVQPTKTTFIKY